MSKSAILIIKVFMRKILIALVISLIAISLATLSTRAAWSDTVTVTNNQIQTGTADLQISTDNGSSWNTSSKQSSLVINNLVPNSEKNGYSFSLWNASTTGVNFGLSGQITAVVGAGADENQLEIAVYKQGSTPTNGTGWITLADWKSASQSLNNSINTGIGNFQNYNIAARLKDTAENDWQGKNVIFTLKIDGQQL